MTSDLDVLRGAAMMMKLHGDDAIVRAAERADALLGRGDMEGRAVWLKIMDAIRELQRKEVPAGAARH